MQTSVFKSSPDAQKKSGLDSKTTKVKNNPFVSSEQANHNPFHDGSNVNPFSPVQMKQAPMQMMEEEEEMQMKKATIQKEGMPEEEELQMKANPVQKKEGSESSISTGGMPSPVKDTMEQALGADFSDVNIHANSQKAPEVGALAYTQGKDIHFAPGEYNPGSQKGNELIGHELTHVVQQSQGRVKATTQTKGIPVNDDAGLEQEADKMGQKAAQMFKK
jgi:hypothetical protein